VSDHHYVSQVDPNMRITSSEPLRAIPTRTQVGENVHIVGSSYAYDSSDPTIIRYERTQLPIDCVNSGSVMHARHQDSVPHRAVPQMRFTENGSNSVTSSVNEVTGLQATRRGTGQLPLSMSIVHQRSGYAVNAHHPPTDAHRADTDYGASTESIRHIHSSSDSNFRTEVRENSWKNPVEGINQITYRQRSVYQLIQVCAYLVLLLNCLNIVELEAWKRFWQVQQHSSVSGME